MAHKSNGQIVRYQKGKIKFEILTKKGAALKFRQKQLGIQHVLMIDAIYTKISQGKVAKSSDLQRVFGTADLNECVIKILENGDLNMSSSERKDKSNAKRNEIVYYIHKNYINPLSKVPHPTTRILHCMEQCKVKLNTTQSTKKQALNAIKKMRGKLFFTKANMLSVRLSIKYKYDTSKIGNLINKITCGDSFQQKWNDKGCVFVLEMTTDDLDALGNTLNKYTNGGDYNLEVVDNGINGTIPGCNVSTKTKTPRNAGKHIDYMMNPKDLKKLNRKKTRKRLNRI